MKFFIVLSIILTSCATKIIPDIFEISKEIKDKGFPECNKDLEDIATVLIEKGMRLNYEKSFENKNLAFLVINDKDGNYTVIYLFKINMYITNEEKFKNFEYKNVCFDQTGGLYHILIGKFKISERQQNELSS